MATALAVVPPFLTRDIALAVIAAGATAALARAALRAALPAAVCGAVAALAATAPSAAAATPYLTRAISDGGAFVTANDPRLAQIALRRGARTGAEVARLPLLWARVEWWTTPRNPTDPADPAYDFGGTDALVRGAVANGLEPLLRIDAAPRAYEAEPRWPYAPFTTWAPDPVAYGRFATAAARRYSGRFPDPQRPGAFLPRVRLWQAWNEPNLPNFLSPQWVAVNGAWTAWSPRHYRQMLNAFYSAVKGVHATNVVATAGTAPNGDPRDGEGRMTPVRFWQALLCLGTPPKITREPCPDPAHFDVLVHHPLTVTDPDVPASAPGNVSVADLYKLKRLLKAAGHSDARLWVTELNWDSPGATAAQLQRWVPRALYRLWADGVDLVSWQFVRDPPNHPEHPAGLYAIDRAAPLDASRDRVKPAALRAFRFPFTGVRRDRTHVALWALLPHPARVRVAVQRRRAGAWVTLRHVTANRHGMVRTTIPLRGAARLRLATKRGASGTWNAPTA